MQIELKDILALLGDKVVQIALLEGQVTALQAEVARLRAPQPVAPPDKV